jgi:hypothetical protein
MQMKFDPTWVKTTIDTHAHPSGILTTVSPGGFDFVDIERKQVLHESRFMRLLATPKSRDALIALFRESITGPRGRIPGLAQGDDGVYVYGGWA